MVSSLDRILNTPIQIGALFPLALDPQNTNDKMKVKEVWSMGSHQTKALLSMEDFQLLHDLIQAESQYTDCIRNHKSTKGIQYPEPWIYVHDIEEDRIWNAEWWVLSLDRYLSNFEIPSNRLDQRLAVALDYLDEAPRQWLAQHYKLFKSMQHFYHDFLVQFGSGPEPYYKRGTIWPPQFSV